MTEADQNSQPDAIDLRAKNATGDVDGRWPKIHLIYFFLAAFDLIAVAGGLYLGHRVIDIFTRTVEMDSQWERRSTEARKLVDIAADANEIGISVFDTGKFKEVRVAFTSEVTSFNTLLNAMRQDIEQNLNAQMAERPLRLLADASNAMRQLDRNAKTMSDQLRNGYVSRANFTLVAMQREYRKLRKTVEELHGLFADVKRANFAANEHNVAQVAKYEYVIGGMIVIMVLCVAAYGHFIGRLIKRKYMELQKANADTRAFAEELETVNREISSLNRDLADNMKKLSEAQEEIIRSGKLAQLGQLTATVAHEIRNPLGAVRTAAFLLERKFKGKVEGVERPLQRINNGVVRCDGIITELLDFARSRTLQREALIIDHWVTGIVREQAERLPPQIDIECRLALGETTAGIDPERMERVLINFLNNASEAMVGKGDVAAAVVTDSPKIIVETRATSRGIEISVKDNGPGISEENLSKILEPLFTTKSFGVGLGLPGVEKILVQHGGGLDIESQEGQGATFTAWFPIESAVKEAA